MANTDDRSLKEDQRDNILRRPSTANDNILASKYHKPKQARKFNLNNTEEDNILYDTFMTENSSSIKTKYTGHFN